MHGKFVELCTRKVLSWHHGWWPVRAGGGSGSVGGKERLAKGLMYTLLLHKLKIKLGRKKPLVHNARIFLVLTPPQASATIVWSLHEWTEVSPSGPDIVWSTAAWLTNIFNWLFHYWDKRTLKTFQTSSCFWKERDPSRRSAYANVTFNPSSSHTYNPCNIHKRLKYEYCNPTLFLWFGWTRIIFFFTLYCMCVCVTNNRHCTFVAVAQVSC